METNRLFILEKVSKDGKHQRTPWFYYDLVGYQTPQKELLKTTEAAFAIQSGGANSSFAAAECDAKAIAEKSGHPVKIRELSFEFLAPIVRAKVYKPKEA